MGMTLLGMALCGLVALGGALIAKGFAFGYVLVGLGASGLGALNAAATDTALETDGLTFDEVMRLPQLLAILQNLEATDDHFADRMVYIGDGLGLQPSSSTFIARLDGGRALVIEAARMEKDTNGNEAE